MTVVGFSPNAQIIDPRDGKLTREGFLLVQFLVQNANGSGAGLTTDGIQTVTNKTISGNVNTLTDIDTDSLESRTGDDEGVVTGTAGAAGELLKWDGNGNAVGGGTALSAETADENYVRADGVLPAAGPVVLASYLVADVPDATAYTSGLIYVSDEAGGPTVAVSDGTDWLRLQDRAVIS